MNILTRAYGLLYKSGVFRAKCGRKTFADIFKIEQRMFYRDCKSAISLLTARSGFSNASQLRFYSKTRHGNQANRDVVYYVSSGIVFMVGFAYACVPLYRMFCQATGIGGDPTLGHKVDNMATMKPIRERPITVTFNADRHAAMQWNFRPSQTRIQVVPGETALAFYTAKNPTDTPIVGVATYNVVPFQAGQYFNKIQCFCFEEQWLNPHEEVDMPVFFYIDPEFDDDPHLARVDEIVLSYTFFKADAGEILPMPGFMNNRFKGAAASAS